ncbi:MAG: hypothetical protein NTY38_07360 [Acidobacteria bacterium]|nr:hypothetical protein [Acidobacteriota bacterium]
MVALAGPAVCEEPSAAEAQKVVNHIQQRVAANYQRLPNYVCRQSIERSKRPLKRKKFESLDTLRLDVALIGGRELYSWPGASKFDDSSLHAMVKSGAIGSGAYATHPRSLFLRKGAKFQYRGEEELEGRKTVRLDFVMPLDKSQFAISDGAREATVPYHGSVWADARTFDLVRLDNSVDQIPSRLAITGSGDSIHYQQVSMGGQEFTLPRTVELRMVSAVGEFLNVTRFEGCRQYVGESSVHFTETEAAPAAAPAQQVVELPERLRVEMTLETPIPGDGKLALGDAVMAVLSRPIQRKDHGVVIPKGARCIGRLTRLESHRVPNLDYTLVGIAFDSIETASLRARFAGDLQDVGMTANGAYYVPFYSSPGQRRSIWNSLRMSVAEPEANEGVFCVRGGGLVLNPGLRMVWDTTKRK